METTKKNAYAYIGYGQMVQTDRDETLLVSGSTQPKGTQCKGSVGRVIDSHLLKGAYGYKVEFGHEDSAFAIVRADQLTVVAPDAKFQGLRKKAQVWY